MEQIWRQHLFPVFFSHLLPVPISTGCQTGLIETSNLDTAPKPVSNCRENNLVNLDPTVSKIETSFWHVVCEPSSITIGANRLWEWHRTWSNGGIFGWYRNVSIGHILCLMWVFLWWILKLFVLFRVRKWMIVGLLWFMVLKLSQTHYWIKS